MKTSVDLENEIRDLLNYSKWREAGPHGRTITAVMKRVILLRKRANRAEPKTALKLVKKAS